MAQRDSVKKTAVVQQLVSMFVYVSVVEEPSISSVGCGEGWGYYTDDPTPICEPIDKIGQGPPPDMAFCAALGCPYNPPNPHQPPSGPSPPPATTPVEPPGPGELSAAECAAIQCDPENPVQPEQEQDSEAEEENTDNDNNNNSGGNDDSTGGNGSSDDGGSAEEGDEEE